MLPSGRFFFTFALRCWIFLYYSAVPSNPFPMPGTMGSKKTSCRIFFHTEFSIHHASGLGISPTPLYSDNLQPTFRITQQYRHQLNTESSLGYLANSTIPWWPINTLYVNELSQGLRGGYQFLHNLRYCSLSTRHASTLHVSQDAQR